MIKLEYLPREERKSLANKLMPSTYLYYKYYYPITFLAGICHNHMRDI